MFHNVGSLCSGVCVCDVCECVVYMCVGYLGTVKETGRQNEKNVAVAVFIFSFIIM